MGEAVHITRLFRVQGQTPYAKIDAVDTPMVVERAFTAFGVDAAAQPPLSLRGANDVDSYKSATPFDPSEDRLTDGYLESYAFWGLAYLDARSWRHYLPHLISYAMAHKDDPRMVVEALIHALRPPDRYPPRLGSLTEEQEAVVREFLEHVAIDPGWAGLQEEAQQALEEWWLPNPRSRPTAAEIDALRRTPVAYRVVAGQSYRLEVPVTLAGSGARDIPEESRRVETWGGYLCGDAHTLVAINVTPIAARSLRDSVALRGDLFSGPMSPRPVEVPGAREAWRLEGLSAGDSPAEPHALIVVIAATRAELVTLSIRTWPREDLARAANRIAGSLTLLPPP